MADYRRATIVGNNLKIDQKATLSKKQALSALRRGDNVYTNKSQAHSLSIALSQGQGSWKDGAHLIGGYKHYHDVSHAYAGHIFYGNPS